MAQLEEAAGDAIVTDDAAATPEELLADSFFEDEQEEEGEAEEAESDTGEEAELTADDLEGETEEDEPETPAIDPPVSWKADAKEAFAKLPAELQKVVSEREAERERFLQQKAQEAASARQTVETAAYEHIAELQRQQAEQLEQYAAQFQPQRPDPRLLQTGQEEHRALYYQQQAAYDAATAQRVQAQQEAQQVRQQQARYEQVLQQREAEAFRETLARDFPEYLDPSINAKLQQELGSIALELGYSQEQIADARATDILAMRKASDWKAKAAKYDALMAKKMEGVRAAKGLKKVARPGSAQTKAQASAGARDTAWQRVKETKDPGAMADWLEKSGFM